MVRRAWLLGVGAPAGVGRACFVKASWGLRVRCADGRQCRWARENVRNALSFCRCLRAAIVVHSTWPLRRGRLLQTLLLLSLKHLTGDLSHGRSGPSGPRVHNLNLFIAASTGRPNASSCLTTSAHITASPGLIYSHSAYRFLSSALARCCTDLHSSAAGADRDLLTSGTGSSR